MFWRPRSTGSSARNKTGKKDGQVGKTAGTGGFAVRLYDGGTALKRESGIARCGLACCLCSENTRCHGCNSGECPDKEWCENRRCSAARGFGHCYECPQDCRKGLLGKSKPYGFTLFAKRYGEKRLLDCLERNEQNGVVYHREGITGDYDSFDDPEALIAFILTGKR